MRAIQFARLADAEVVAGRSGATATAAGDVTSRRLRIEDFPLWAYRTELAPGATLTWDGPHGDEGLYVLSGALEVDGRECPTGGAVLVEAGVPAIVSTRGGAEVVHVGPADPEPPTDGAYGPPADGPRIVHVIGPGGTFATVEGTRETRMFADATCDTCRIMLFVTGRTGTNRSPRHSHSVDEVLVVLRGTLTFGSYRLEPGDAVAIAGGQPYAFRGDGAGPEGVDGYQFLNYRRDVSEMTSGDGPPMLEGGAVRNMTPVGDVR
jgi:quercetin dioxygenase-like cupin family protein